MSIQYGNSQELKAAVKRRRTKMRFRKNDPGHNLLAACQHWIEHHEGRAVVIGGIEIQKWPLAGPLRYKIAVNVTGTPPKRKDATLAQ